MVLEGVGGGVGRRGGKRVTLTKGVHQALADLPWLAQDLERLSTRLYKLVPLHQILDGYHDASG